MENQGKENAHQKEKTKRKRRRRQKSRHLRRNEKKRQRKLEASNNLSRDETSDAASRGPEETGAEHAADTTYDDAWQEDRIATMGEDTAAHVVREDTRIVEDASGECGLWFTGGNKPDPGISCHFGTRTLLAASCCAVRFACKPHWSICPQQTPTKTYCLSVLPLSQISMDGYCLGPGLS